MKRRQDTELKLHRVWAHTGDDHFSSAHQTFYPIEAGARRRASALAIVCPAKLPMPRNGFVVSRVRSGDIALNP
jgi:hypothetical protein